MPEIEMVDANQEPEPEIYDEIYDESEIDDDFDQYIVEEYFDQLDPETREYIMQFIANLMHNEYNPKN
jgi:hypothetical protein